MFITINHIEEFYIGSDCRPGIRLTLKKDHSNPYDDEAIAVYRNGSKFGYVANSVCTVCRGTYSAGRLYDHFEEETECIIRFAAVEDGFVIAEMDCQNPTKENERS